MILALAFGAAAWGQKVTNSKLSADSVLIGDQVVWSFDFTVPENSPIGIGQYSEILARDTSVRGSVEAVTEIQLDSLSVKNGLEVLASSHSFFLSARLRLR